MGLGRQPVTLVVLQHVEGMKRKPAARCEGSTARVTQEIASRMPAVGGHGWVGGLCRFDSLREADSGSAVGVVAQEPSPWMAPRCRAILHKARWGEQFVISDQKKSRDGAKHGDQGRAGAGLRAVPHCRAAGAAAGPGRGMCVLGRPAGDSHWRDVSCRADQRLVDGRRLVSEASAGVCAASGQQRDCRLGGLPSRASRKGADSG